MTLNAASEVGKLRRVMVHRPGLEHTRLTPANAADLLFDDVLWVKQAKQEHDAFASTMRDRGVEVFEAEKLLAEALAVPVARDWVIDHILNERQVGITASRAGAASGPTSAAPTEVADFLIGGITKDGRRGRHRASCGRPATRRHAPARRCPTSCSSGIRPAGSSTASRSTR